MSIRGTSTAPQDIPMRDALLKQLDRLHDLSYGVFSSIGPIEDGSQQRPPPDSAAFLACDAALAATVKQARLHQIKHRRIEALKDEIMELEESLRDILDTLDMGKHDLDEMIDDGERDLKAMQKTKEAAIPYDALMQYAEHLGPFTSVPPSFPPYHSALLSADGQLPAPPFRIPYPTAEELRRGRLNEGPGMSLIGESREVGVVTKPPHLPEGVIPSGGQPEALHERPPAHVPAIPPAAAAMDVFVDLDLNPDM